MKPRLCLGELTWVNREPVPGQRSTSEKQLLSSKLEPAIRSSDTGQRIPCFERCQ